MNFWWSYGDFLYRQDKDPWIRLNMEMFQEFLRARLRVGAYLEAEKRCGRSQDHRT